MDALLQSFFIVFAGEMGDKTQLLALVLATRYRKPWTVLAGILIATTLNHALASWAGGWVSTQLAPRTMAWVLAASFFIFAAWVLIPDKETEMKEHGHFGAFVTTIIAFFLAEMGDKTQLATIALGAKFENVLLVTIGTTSGMMVSNALAIFFGPKLLAKVPMKWIHIFASLLFVACGIGVLIGY